MTVVGRTWERLTIPGKILAVVIPLGAVLTAGLALLIALIGGAVVQFLVDNLPLVRFVVAATIVLLMTVPSAFLIIYMEMKVIALMNLRYGPDRVGPFGSALSVVHGLKVLMKEDFTPTSADVPVFTLAPVVVYMSSVMSLLVLPFAPGIFGQDFNIGLLYFFAMGGLTVVGLLMAGWSSFNKYSLLGGLRSAAQVVSYEIPLTLSVVGVILLAGTLSINKIVLGPGRQRPRLVHLAPAAGLRDLLHRGHRRGQPDAVRPDRGRLGDRGRLRHRVLGDALRLLLLRRVRQRVHRLGPDRGPVHGRLERTVQLALAGHRRPGSGRPRNRPAVPAGARAAGRGARPGAALLPAQQPGEVLAGADHRLRPVQPAGRGGRPGAGLPELRLGRRPAVVHGQDLRLRVHLRLDAGHPAPGPDRPADGLRLEVAPAGLAAQPVRDRRRDPGRRTSEARSDELRFRAWASSKGWP